MVLVAPILLGHALSTAQSAWSFYASDNNMQYHAGDSLSQDIQPPPADLESQGPVLTAVQPSRHLQHRSAEESSSSDFGWFQDALFPIAAPESPRHAPTVTELLHPVPLMVNKSLLQWVNVRLLGMSSAPAQSKSHIPVHVVAISYISPTS